MVASQWGIGNDQGYNMDFGEHTGVVITQILSDSRRKIPNLHRMSCRSFFLAAKAFDRKCVTSAVMNKRGADASLNSKLGGQRYNRMLGRGR